MERAPPTRGHWPFRTLFLGAGGGRWGGWPSHETSCLNTGAVSTRWGKMQSAPRHAGNAEQRPGVCEEPAPQGRRGRRCAWAQGKRCPGAPSRGSSCSDTLFLRRAPAAPGRAPERPPARTELPVFPRRLPQAPRLSAPNPQLPVFPRGGLPLGWTLDHRPTGVYCLCFPCSFGLYVPEATSRGFTS